VSHVAPGRGPPGSPARGGGGAHSPLARLLRAFLALLPPPPPPPLCEERGDDADEAAAAAPDALGTAGSKSSNASASSSGSGTARRTALPSADTRSCEEPRQAVAITWADEVMACMRGQEAMYLLRHRIKRSRSQNRRQISASSDFRSGSFCDGAGTPAARIPPGGPVSAAGSRSPGGGCDHPDRTQPAP
jgi:hypothetical protein